MTELYLLDLYFRCRRSGGFGYASQRQSRGARGLAKAALIKRRLGGTGVYGEPVPPRPKGMHRSTYEQLSRAVADAEAPSQQGQWQGLQRLLRECGLRPEGEQADEAQTMRAAKRAFRNPDLLKRRNRPRSSPRAKPNP